MIALRRLILPALALLVGVAGGHFAVDEYQNRSTEQDKAAELRLVVTADQDWYGHLVRTGGCASVPVNVYNAGDRPIELHDLVAQLIADPPHPCRPEKGGVTLPSHESTTVRAAVGFWCEHPLSAPRYSAVVDHPHRTIVRGGIDMPRFDGKTVCGDEPMTARWYVSETGTIVGKGANATLPLTLSFHSPVEGAALTSIELWNSEAFALRSPPLPINLGSPNVSGGPPEVFLPVRLSVRNCESARHFTSDDLVASAMVSPETEPSIHELVLSGERTLVLRLTRLVEAVCG